MAKMNKDQMRYIEGMERALRIVKDKGVEELEKEVRYRSKTPLPLNVSPEELQELTRLYARETFREEFDHVGVANAMTMVDHMKFPPSMVVDFLEYSNLLIDEYRRDPDRFKADEEYINKDRVLHLVIKKDYYGGTE